MIILQFKHMYMCINQQIFIKLNDHFPVQTNVYQPTDFYET